MKERLQKRFKDLQKKQKKGFTLIELIVVLVILGIILALTVPAITSYIDDANDAKYMANARAVFVVAEAERVRAISTGTSSTADWAGDATIISNKSTVKVSEVRYTAPKAATSDTAATEGTYTFNLLAANGTKVEKEITVKPNKDIVVENPTNP